MSVRLTAMAGLLLALGAACQLRDASLRQPINAALDEDAGRKADREAKQREQTAQQAIDFAMGLIDSEPKFSLENKPMLVERKDGDGNPMPGAPPKLWCHSTLTLIDQGLIQWCQNTVGRRHGPYAELTEDHKPKTQGVYNRDQRHGEWESFYPVGTLSVRGSYKYGKEHGSWVWYHPNEQLARVGDYLNGKAHGLWTEYRPDGSKLNEGTFLHGQKHGKWQTFDKNDAPSGSENWDMGKRK